MERLIIDSDKKDRKLPVLFKKVLENKQINHFLKYADFDNTLIGKWTIRFGNAALRGYVRVKYIVYKVILKVHKNLFVIIFRLAVITLVVFVYNQKEIQFSVDFESPGFTFHTEPRLEGGFPIAQMVSFKSPMIEAPEASNQVQDLTELDVNAYIKRFSKVASVEMEKFGIPASLKMGMAILESRAGSNPKAMSINNHFGALMDGEYYQSAWKNWRAHSEFLKKNFSFLFTNGMNYRRWAEAIQNSDYTDDKQYAEKILKIIEDYQLYLLDEI